MSGQLRVNNITDEAGTGSPNFPNKIAPSSLGTGTPSSSNFLRGDGTWQTIETTPTTDQVLTATAGAAYGAVGTYVLAWRTGSAIIEGSTYAGSGLFPSGFESGSGAAQAADGRWTAVGTRGPTSLSGTWRAMGRISTGFYNNTATMFLRIS